MFVLSIFSALRGGWYVRSTTSSSLVLCCVILWVHPTKQSLRCFWLEARSSYSRSVAKTERGGTAIEIMRSVQNTNEIAQPADSMGWPQCLVMASGWILLSVLTAAQRQWLSPPPQTLSRFLVNLGWSATIWLFWLVATPVIFWLSCRLPLRRGTLHWTLPTHFGLAAVFGLLHLACWAAISGLDTWRGGAPYSFAVEFVRLLQVLLYVEVVFYWALLGAGLARQAFREAHARELQAQALMMQLQEARLLALKQQLHPHFLFNALNTVAMFVRNGEQQQAVQMIASLGELLRWSLSERAAPEVTLAEELEAARRYLAIEQFRFPDQLHVEFNVSEALFSAAVPNLVLQPLIENAVRHGIAKAATAGVVTISAIREDDRLELCVVDDGPGFPANWQPGIGLGNTRARLQQLGLPPDALCIAAREPHGTRVQLRLPYRLLA